MKIIVTGGSSFTGGAFIKVAEAKGHDVVELSRPHHDLNADMPRVAANLVRLGYDHLVNFAALNMVAESWEFAPDYYQTNITGIAALGEAVALARVKKMVQVSTPEVYGATQTFLKEGAPFNPSTPYAISRAAGDWHLGLLHRQMGLPVCFTRTVNVYGVGQQLYRVIPKTALAAFLGRTLQLHGGGASTRSFIHVNDVATGILAVLESGVPGADYHMATARQTSIRDLVGIVCELSGAKFSEVAKDVPERPGKDNAYQLDDSKIRNELGWSDTVNLEDGLAEVVEWIRANLNEFKKLPTEYKHRP